MAHVLVGETVLILNRDRFESHGYLMIANGIPCSKGLLRSTKWTDMADAMDWVYSNAGWGD